MVRSRLHASSHNRGACLSSMWVLAMRIHDRHVIEVRREAGQIPALWHGTIRINDQNVCVAHAGTRRVMRCAVQAWARGVRMEPVSSSARLMRSRDTSITNLRSPEAFRACRSRAAVAACIRRLHRLLTAFPRARSACCRTSWPSLSLGLACTVDV